MKRIFYLLFFLPGIFFSCANKSYQRNANGISVTIKNDTGSYLLRLTVVNKNIIHVIASPTGKISKEKSLMAISHPATTVPWKVTENNGKIILSTDSVSVMVDESSGELDYSDKKGKEKLAELSGGGKSFTPIHVEGKKYYTIRQIFESPDSEAFYGLGQHQQGLMNYKGKDVNLTQENIVAVNPFVVSSRNYGILWDNYSITKFGDPRKYKEISNLILFSEDGKRGGLTARYTSLKNPKKVYLKRIENKIDYQYLTNIKDIPSVFPVADGKVTWTGSMVSKFSGLNRFAFYSGGYLKVWIEGKLILNSWRQTWNPWYRMFQLDMKAGKKYTIKIEWIPDSGQSFIAVKWLSPDSPEEQRELSLWSEVADEINYYFVNGSNLDEVISGYRYITGKSPIMPKWAMGLWQSRERYKTQKQLLGVVKEFRQKNIPLDNIVQDWFYWPESKWGDHDFDSTRYPDPKGMINELHHQLNTHIMISVWPKFYVGTKNYNYMKKKGWLYMYNIKNKQRDWVGPGYVSTFYDAFNPNARKYFWQQINKKLFSKGIDAWWLDATEPDILSNSSIAERKKLMDPTYLGPSAKYFNAYSLMNCEAVYDGQRRTDTSKRVFILTRSAYAGQQRYAAATWSGDVVSRWHDLKVQISAGINFCIAGIPYWTTDIGGFALEKRYEHPNSKNLEEWRELNTRWYQFGAFCPLFRVHGQFPYREIFNIAPPNNPAYKSMLYYDKLRYRLMPYIYTLAGMTYHNDYTIMRALVMDFPKDTTVRDIGDQFMFGPALMVCPVYTYKARNRNVYLPKSPGWYDFNTGKFYEGGQKINANAPYERIPLFVKAGSIIPVGPAIMYAMQSKDKTMKIFVYGGADGTFSLYEDADINYNYEKGAFSTIKFTYNAAQHTLTIGKRKGKFNGELTNRTFEIVYIGKDTGKGFDADMPPVKTVQYNGKEQVVNLSE